MPTFITARNLENEILHMSPQGRRKLAARDPSFPRPIRLSSSPNARPLWLAEEVERWLAARAAARDRSE